MAGDIGGGGHRLPAAIGQLLVTAQAGQGPTGQQRHGRCRTDHGQEVTGLPFLPPDDAHQQDKSIQLQGPGQRGDLDGHVHVPHRRRIPQGSDRWVKSALMHQVALRIRIPDVKLVVLVQGTQGLPVEVHHQLAVGIRPDLAVQQAQALPKIDPRARAHIPRPAPGAIERGRKSFIRRALAQEQIAVVRRGHAEIAGQQLRHRRPQVAGVLGPGRPGDVQKDGVRVVNAGEDVD
ncbi:hypothetical protein RY27_04505, partial [Litorilinea aerophila]